MAMKMDIGQLVDFVAEWNWRQERAAEQYDEEGNLKPKRRKATQADWDALGG